jgi:hypothetical protein
MSGGTKHDQEKPRMDLLSSKWLVGVSEVLGYGAKKYSTETESGAHNWRNGLDYSRLVGAALRHLTAFNDGEDLDPETKLSHLLHASCCMMFLYEMTKIHPERDDRWKGPSGKGCPEKSAYEKYQADVIQSMRERDTCPEGAPPCEKIMCARHFKGLVKKT